MPSPELTFVVGLILLLGFFLEGLGVYQAVMFSIPLLGLFLGVKVMAAVLSVVDLIMSYVHYNRMPKRVDLKPVRTQLVSMLAGTLIGAMLLRIVPDEFLRIVLGLVIIAIGYDVKTGGMLLAKFNALSRLQMEGFNVKPAALRFAVGFSVFMCAVSVLSLLVDVPSVYFLASGGRNLANNPSLYSVVSQGKRLGLFTDVCQPQDAACVEADAVRSKLLLAQMMEWGNLSSMSARILALAVQAPLYALLAWGLWRYKEWARVLSVFAYSLLSMVLLLDMSLNTMRLLPLLELVLAMPVVVYMMRDDVRLMFTGAVSGEIPEAAIATATDKNLCFVSGLGGGLFMLNRPTLMLHMSNKYGSPEVAEPTASAFFFYDALFRFFMFVLLGLMSLNILLFSLMMAPFILIGVFAGRTRVALDVMYFRSLLLLVLVLCAVIMILWGIMPTLRILF